MNIQVLYIVHKPVNRMWCYIFFPFVYLPSPIISSLLTAPDIVDDIPVVPPDVSVTTTTIPFEIPEFATTDVE